MTKSTSNPVAELRHHAALSQSAFAAKVGTSQPTISQYEAGKKSPTLDTLDRMAQHCDVVPVIRFIPSPESVIKRARRHLRTVTGVESAWLYGSYARLAAGEQVLPGDVDIIIIGSVSPIDRARAETVIGTDLAMRVDLTVVSAEDWQAGTSGFVQHVRAAPRRKIL